MLDLSRIKVVGFIADFNPKMGYPEFATKVEVKPKSKGVQFVAKEHVKRVLTGEQVALRNAKRSFRKTAASMVKPKTVALFSC